MLQLEDITAGYGDAPLFSRLSLSVARGEMRLIQGASGCGKSTLLGIICGTADAALTWSGDVRLNDQSLSTLPAEDRRVGLIFQDALLFPHMTVGENLAFPLQVRNMLRAEVEEKVRGVLDMVQMLGFIDRKPAQLSGGQQQRIALARALVFNPELVLMDEPLGALDKQLREHMQYEIKHIHENLGVTVVYVTHDQSEALTMSNRIAVFDDGIIQQLADPVTLYEKPENAFVAQFIGEIGRAHV